MRTPLLLLLSCCLFSFCSAQQDSLKAMMDQGIALHDKGDYEGAIKIYDQVIGLDNNYYLAYYEKSLSLYTWTKYQDCADLSKEILRKFPDNKDLRHVYVNYGSSMDVLGQTADALKIYSDGIKKYPDFYLLVFNRGVTEFVQQQFDDAVKDMKKSVSLKPVHTSSHLYLGYCIYKKNKMAAVMALSTFLLLEPQGPRAEKALKVLLQLLGSNVEKKDDKTINITLDASALDDKKGGEDDFHLIELMVSMTGALDYDDKHKVLSPAERLKSKLELLASIPGDDGKKKKKGFFTNFYIPFFAAMEAGNYMETASNIIYSAAGDETTKKWLSENQDNVQKFNKWLDAYKWNGE